MKNSHISLLFKKIAEGDMEALKQFISEYGACIISSADRVLKDKALSDDVLSDVLLKLWQNAYKIKDFDNITGYVSAMAYNRAIDIKRKQREVFFDFTQENSLELSCQADDEKIFIDSILCRMEEPLRSVLILKASCGYSFYDIARIKGISYKQARNIYLKACGIFKELYKR